MVRLPAQNVKLRTLETFLSSRFRPLKSCIFGEIRTFCDCASKGDSPKLRNRHNRIQHGRLPPTRMLAITKARQRCGMLAFSAKNTSFGSMDRLRTSAGQAIKSALMQNCVKFTELECSQIRFSMIFHCFWRRDSTPGYMVPKRANRYPKILLGGK